MSTEIIVSYDGTPNDDDALALAKLLAPTRAAIALAYVRHSREFDPGREELAQHDAERRLEHGATWLGDADIPRHVVVSPSTGEGLATLADEEGASMVVFGSDYRTAPGHVEPGTTAQYLLEGGPVAIAVAPAGLRMRASRIETIAAGADDAATRTARTLATKLGAEVVVDGDADLIVVGSHAAAPEGRIALSGATRTRLNAARSPVLVVPHGKPVLLRAAAAGSLAEPRL
jgi:nucleotide-binding universal stress UspA family protein